MAPRSAMKKQSSAEGTGKRKKLSFDESTVRAAAAAVQTTHVNTSVKLAAKRGATTTTTTSARRKDRVTTPTRKAAQRQGIVRASQAEEDKDAAAHHDDEDDEKSSDDEDDMLNGDDVEDLSDVAGRSSSDDDDDDDAATTRAGAGAKARRAQRGSDGAVKPYHVVRLSFLPPEFQEPQLCKFLNQFGATVVNCFCVRSKRSHRSRGVAYVEFDKESVIPLVVEECHGMALGGMSVRARAVVMRRAMPTAQMVSRRRALAYAQRTKGAPLKHHDVRRKDPVAALVKAVRTEAENNKYLKSLGIDFRSDFFASQLTAVPPGLLRSKSPAARLQAATTAASAKAAVVAGEEAPAPEAAVVAAVASAAAASPVEAEAPSAVKKTAAPSAAVKKTAATPAAVKKAAAPPAAVKKAAAAPAAKKSAAPVIKKKKK